MTEKVFTVDLECRNCGNEWQRDVEPGGRVQGPSTTRDGVKIRCDENTLSHDTRECDICTFRIECPVCELQDTVTVNDRNPIP